MKKRKQIVLIDLFSGTGGFPKGMQDVGVLPDHHYFSEIEGHAIANYKYNFPKAKFLGDVKTVSGREIRTRHREAIIIVTFGWPCQDNSIAGRREGQRHSAKRDLHLYEKIGGQQDNRGSCGSECLEQAEGNRSGLLYEAVRVIRESRSDYFIGENVKGLLSVNSGVDIVESLEILAGLLEGGTQYDLSMQLSNTLRYLPQNRERTYFIGRASGESRPQVLSHFFPVVSSDTPKRKSAGKRTVKVGKTVRSEAAKAERRENLVRGVDTHAFGEKTLEFRDQNYMNTLVKRLNGDHIIEIVDKYGNPKEKTYASTLQSSGGGNHSDMDLVAEVSKEATRYRRLTEIECERIQGFPDNWTKYGIDPKGNTYEIAATPRYAMIGNAVSTVSMASIATLLKPELGL